MRILVKIMGFGGGAPLSLLQYAKYWKNTGHEIIVMGKYFGAEELFAKEGIVTENVAPFIKREPLKILKTIKYVEKRIKEYQPDLIVWWTEDEAVFGRILSDRCGIPSAYVFAGGKMLNHVAAVLSPRKVLVFSKENELDLINQGYPKDEIYQISNRIQYIEGEGDYSKLQKIELPFNAILLSRITTTLFESIKTSISIVEYVNKIGIKISLSIYGKGEMQEQLISLIKNTNSRIGWDAINYGGYITDTGLIVKNAQLAFGRGRSVIEPMMYGAVGVIVDDNGKFSVCNIDSYQNLADNNFSGRNIAYMTSKEEIELMINDLINKTNNIKEFESMRMRLLADYAAPFGYEKIDTYINDIISSFKVKHRKKIIGTEIFKTYIKIFVNRKHFF